MRHTLLVLTFLMGCASPQHRHPHDHGLSALKGQMARIVEENESLHRCSLDLQIKLDQTSAENSALETRLAAAEKELLRMDLIDIVRDGVTRLDKQLVSLAKQFSTNNADIAEQLIAHDEKLKPIDALRRQIEDVEDSLEDLEESLKKFKPQKLIELRPDLEDDEDDEEEVWDGKMIGPPRPEKD